MKNLKVARIGQGRNDLRQFVKLCDEIGLKVHLRIGPYCNAEIRNGGFPTGWSSTKISNAGQMILYT